MTTSGPRPAPARPRFSPARTVAVFRRNVEASRHRSYLWVLLSGMFEPVFYLASIGLGVGALVGEASVGGRVVPYAEFVAPAMLAASVMNGAVSESTFNFFKKLRLMRLHDATACTPVSSLEVVAGEALWSVGRGAVHSVPFLVLTCATGLIPWSAAPALFVATLLVGAAFAGFGLSTSTFLDHTHQFDRVNLLTFSMFVFSGTFIPTSDYPPVLDFLAQCTPLAQAVDLTRALATGTGGWGVAGHGLYLLAFFVAGVAVASRRIERELRG